MAVASTGPASTSSPVAKAVSRFRYLFCEPPPIICNFSTERGNNLFNPSIPFLYLSANDNNTHFTNSPYVCGTCCPLSLQ